MKLKKSFLSILILLIIYSCNSKKEQSNDVLWYAQPAEKWMQALPVGNGRLGAMVFGDPQHERIQLNEDSMWPGAADWGDFRGSPEDLDQIKALLNQGKTQEVDSLIVEKFSYKTIVRSHQTMGDLYIDFHEDKTIEDYSRSLSLDDALVQVNYTSGGNTYTQKVFTSKPDDVLVIELTTTNPSGMDFSLKMNRPKDKGRPTAITNNPSVNEISMKGIVTQFGGKRNSKPFPLDYGVKFEARLKVKNESGSVTADKGQLVLKDVMKATIYLVGNTSFYHGEDYEAKNLETLKEVSNKPFSNLLTAHKEDYQNLYGRMQFDLGGKTLDSLPTDVRLQRIKDGSDDPDLAAKLFQYGRYLLISSSRPGTNPANLQGIWNEHVEAPWNADYHLNINL
ncbi:MAG: glycoside hydrolase family 95 protein, partial [Maribacter sp.]|nr:glycoside hydrolase family 95 protein [Maribacter sp.]